MAKFNTIEKIVLSVLEESTESRKDDLILLYKVCEKLNPDVLYADFGEVIYNHKLWNLPNWETVSRCRRKIQSERSDLIEKDALKIRMKEENKYKEYVKG